VCKLLVGAGWRRETASPSPDTQGGVTLNGEKLSDQRGRDPGVRLQDAGVRVGATTLVRLHVE